MYLCVNKIEYLICAVKVLHRDPRDARYTMKIRLNTTRLRISRMYDNNDDMIRRIVLLSEIRFKFYFSTIPLYSIYIYIDRCIYKKGFPKKFHLEINSWQNFFQKFLNWKLSNENFLLTSLYTDCTYYYNV